jgi:hypothetical protein
MECADIGASSGTLTLRVRGTNSKGEVQPAEPNWNGGGCMRSVIERVQLNGRLIQEGQQEEIDVPRGNRDTRWASRSVGSGCRGSTGRTCPSIAADGSVILHSVSINRPDSDRTFPGGGRTDAINNNCLACHSAGMVLTQPSLSRAA